MCFELAELYLENSLFLVKACLCNDRINAQNQQGSRWFSHCLGRERRSHIVRNICISFQFACVCIYMFTYVCVKVRKCPDGAGHSERALLLPRVYLQTVTLIQCNDYFYSRYFGSLLALSWMAPHWPTDYLCGCTWLLQLSSLSTITPWEPSPFYYYTFICSSLSRSLSLNHHSTLSYTFIFFSVFLCYTFFIISWSLSSSPLLNHYTFTPLLFLI